MTEHKPQYKGILGIDERISPVDNSSYKLVNWTIDAKSKGWDNRIGYESLIPKVETRTDWAGFQNGGPVNSVYMWNTHQGAKSWLLYEQAHANAITKTFPTDANANLSLHYWKGGTLDKVTIDAQRSVPANDEVYTHYNPIGRLLVILSGNGKPIKFDGIKPYNLGFMEAPSPPVPWKPNTANTVGLADTTIMPINPHTFDMDKSYGLGSSTVDAKNRYRWKVAFLFDNGAQSPLSSASLPVDWITTGAIPGPQYDSRRQAIFLENMPVGPDGTVARILYRTKNLTDGQTSNEVYYYCDTIVNNYETEYVDYTKDTRLGANAPDDDASILFPAPSTRFSATFKNCLFIDGGQTEPQRIYFSQPLKPDQYRALDFFDVGSRAGGDVTALFTYYNNLLVFRENAIDVIRGDSTGGFEIVPLVQGIGTRGLHTISLVPEAGVMFLSTEGVFLVSGGFDGGAKMAVDKISEPILDTVKRMSKSMIARACGIYSEKWREYHVYFAADGSSVNNLGLVFHMDKKSWSVREGFPVNCITIDTRGELIFGHNLGQVQPAFGAITGMRPDETGLFFISRTRNAGHTATLVGELAPTYVIGEAGPLTSLWISANHDFGVGQIKKHVKNVYLNCYTEGSNLYNVFYNKDYSTTYTVSQDCMAQRPEYLEQYIYNTTTGVLVYGPAASAAQTVPTWEAPMFTMLKYPIANAATSTFSVGIKTSNDFILIDYSLEFNASNTETKAARTTSAY